MIIKSFDFEDDAYLLHYGRGHLDGGHSGRYPWGSGETPYQRFSTFYESYRKLKEQGLSNEEICSKWGCTVAEGFLVSYNGLLSSGKTEKEIAEMWGLTTTELRPLRTQYAAEMKSANIARARYLRYCADGNPKMSIAAVAEEMNESESTVRGWLNNIAEDRQSAIDSTAAILRTKLENGEYVDIGRGISAQMGVSDSTLKAAVAKLKEEGYEIQQVQIAQVADPNQKTTVKCICPAGTTYGDVVKNTANITLPVDVYSLDSGKTFNTLQYPASLDSSRLMIKYDDVTYEDGFNGTARDGLMQIRRGVDDLDLGNSNYAQVRILVDDQYYLKGMAMYSDDMPDGVDIIFNTNKNSSQPINKVLKEIKDTKDPQAVFGATIKAGGQSYFEDENGKYKGEDIGLEAGKLYSLSCINKVNEEGDWGEWSKTLASQMLSKQSTQLVEKQLSRALTERQSEYDDIMSLENEVLKESMLREFADGCDAAAVDLKAAAMPRQASQVLIPIPSLKDDEIYAPNYENGETVVLIRYPHGGTFEIPELTVNNNQKEAKSALGKAKDAVGVSLATAEKLSGADFDGDTALVIPNNDGAIKTQKSLPGLKNFNPKDYKDETLPKMSDKTKQLEMGKVSNLITDMTIQGATTDELERAVRHSMVVIDAQKHSLNYKQSYVDNNIKELENKYQDGGGASTLISRASSEARVAQRKEGAYVTTENGTKRTQYINPETGEKMYRETGDSYKEYKTTVSAINEKTGKETTRSKWVTYSKLISEHPDAVNEDGSVDKTKIQNYISDTRDVGKTTKSTKMYEAKDAYELSSGSKVESLYADYANACKSLGNEARLNSLNTKSETVNKEARSKYAPAVSTINEKIKKAEMNAPLERQAQQIANNKAQSRIQSEGVSNDSDKVKKIKNQELAAARASVGASGKESKVKLTDYEWEAIQAGAISQTMQKKLFANCDKDSLRDLAMPKERTELTSAQIAKIKTMSGNDKYTQADIASALGVSVSTVRKYM